MPVVLAALLLAVLWLPSAQDEQGRRESPDAHPPRGLRGLDPLGVVLLCAAVVLIMLPFIQFRSLAGAVLALAGAGLLTLWTLWERRLGRRHPAEPMVNLRLFTLPSFTLNSAVLSLYFMGMPAVWAIVAIYVQQGLGHGALAAGIVTLPSAAMMVLFGAQVGRRAPRIGPQMLVTGTAVAVLSMLALAGAAALMVTEYSSLWWIGVALGLNGLSQVLIIPTAQTLSMQDVPEQMAGAAGGVAQTAQRIFTAVGIAVVTAIYFTVTEQDGHQAGIILGSLVIGGLMLCSVAAAVFAARRARQA